MTEDMSSYKEELSRLLYPTRYDIFLLLQKSKKSLYASKIASELGISRKLASFHLAALEKDGYVTSNFGLANPPKGAPKAVKYYQITDKADRIIKKFTDSLKKI